ncbi:MAG: hypothetical protein EPGJADBJ_02803 [Saprospiraceae bacterium]|nr:hypothetical protein [Saprospiraceae bacterium]
MFSSLFRKFSQESSPEHQRKLDLPEVDPDQHTEIAHLRKKNERDESIGVQPFKRPYLLSARTYALLVTALLLLSAGLGIWSWTRLKNLQNIRQAENEAHEAVLDSLVTVKNDLESNLSSLGTTFAELSVTNDSLAQSLNEATNLLAEKEEVIREIQAENAREEKALRAQVQRLQTLKDRYETVIAILNNQNAELRAENARLRGTADSLTWQVSDLARKLEAQIRQTQSAQFKASSFRVEMERRNDKLTVRARKTREIKVSFELNDVPPSYQGNQQIYLAITDDKGIPVPSKNPIRATIRTPKGNVEIIAQQTQLQNVIRNQRIELNYKLDDRLKGGTYVAAVYSEKGLLGVTSFRLI